MIREHLDDNETTPPEEMFYSILRNLAVANGGYLPVTHETENKNVPSIKREGIKDLDHGIYLFVGWHDEPQWISIGKGTIIHARIPLSKIRYIVPDDRFGTDGFEDFLLEFPDVEGGEIGYSGGLIPSRDIVRIFTP